MDPPAAPPESSNQNTTNEAEKLKIISKPLASTTADGTEELNHNTDTSETASNEISYSSSEREIAERILQLPSNFYKILQIFDPTIKNEIQESYRALSLLVHSDKNKYPGANEVMKNKKNSLKIII